MQRLPQFLRVLSLWHRSFHPDTSAAIIPGRSHNAIILGRSHSRHYTRIPQSPLYLTDLTAAIIPGRSHSRHYTRPISQPPLYRADLTVAILPGRSHSRNSICLTFHLLRIFHTWRLPPDGRGGRFNFQLSLQIKMSFKLKHLTIEHSCSELVPSIQNFPASLHGNLAIHTFSSVCFFDWELIVLN